MLGKEKKSFVIPKNFESKKALGFSLIEKVFSKKASMRSKDFEKHKQKSLRLSIFISLFIWLFVGIIEKNILQSGAISLIAMALLFVFMLQLPVAKRKAYSKKVEAELPVFLIRIVNEIKCGKSFIKAISDASASENSFAANEFKKVVEDVHKGSSVQEALAKMNERLSSMSIRRTCSNLTSIYLNGTKKPIGLKKLAEELLLKQRIESKEFSGKMVVYALVFIAVSAIVPAMFLSFVLIGSYFMKLSFTPLHILLISALMFPLIDASILFLINSKTPLFLRQGT